MPGENRELVISLSFPVALAKGQKFAIREGNKTIGAGVVTEAMGFDPKIKFEGREKVQPKGAKGTTKPAAKK